MDQIKRFFSDLWDIKNKYNVTLPRYTVFFFDSMPGVPVVYFNFCQLGEKNQSLGVIVNIKSEEIKIDLGKKI